MYGCMTTTVINTVADGNKYAPKLLFTWIFLAFVMTSISAEVFATDNDRLMRLESALSQLSDRVEMLETENADLRGRLSHLDSTEPVVVTQLEPQPIEAEVDDRWSSHKIAFHGDMYFRHEQIELEGVGQQRRDRLRMRANTIVTLSDEVAVGFGLSSGGFSPLSGTQSLGGGGRKKEVALDMAYFDWSLRHNTHIIGGKFANPLLTPPTYRILWDDEWRPEGVAIKVDHESWFARLMGNWLESDNFAGDRNLSWHAQTGYKGEFGNSSFALGAGYHDFSISGESPYYGLLFRGNSKACSDESNPLTCVYLNNYRVVSLFGSWNVDLSKVRLGVYAHVVNNLAVDDYDTAWTLGATISTLSEQPFKFEYYYQDLQADALLANLAYSDFGGGGTNKNGHVFQATWKATKFMSFALAYFNNKVDINTDDPRDYKRARLTASFVY